MFSLQVALVMGSAACLLAVTVMLVRKGLLTARYALGWSTLAVVAFFGGPILGLVSERIGLIGFTQTGFSLGVILLLLTAICVQLSISLSGLITSTRELSESIALLRAEVDAQSSQRVPTGDVGDAERLGSKVTEVEPEALPEAERTPAA